MKMNLFVKISALLIAFAGVVLLMKWLQGPSSSSSSRSGLEFLLGTDAKPFNWCGSQAQNVHIFGKGLSETDALPLNSRDQSRICEVLIEPVAAEEVTGEFLGVAQAQTAEGPVVLEQNEAGVFRVKGLPFRSKVLTKALSELQ